MEKDTSVKKTYLSLILILVVIGATIIIWQKYHHDTTQPHLQAVHVAPVMLANIPNYISAVGHIVATTAKKRHVTYHLPKKTLHAVKVGQPVIITKEGDSDHPYIGHVTDVSAIIPKSQTILLTATIPDPDNMLAPKQIVDIKQQVGILAKQKLVPEQAIVSGGPKTAYLFVVSDGKIQKREVKLGAHYNKFIAVSGKINAVETVAVSNLNTLRNGQEVRIVQ